MDFFDRRYSIVLEIKDTINRGSSLSYHDLHLEIESECGFKTKLYHKRDDFNFTIVNFPCVAAFQQHLHMVYIFLYLFQLIRYSRACGSYHDVFDRRLLLTRKLLDIFRLS